MVERKLIKAIKNVSDKINKENVVKLDRNYIEHAYAMFDVYAELVSKMEAHGITRGLLKELADDSPRVFN